MAPLSETAGERERRGTRTNRVEFGMDRERNRVSGGRDRVENDGTCQFLNHLATVVLSLQHMRAHSERETEKVRSMPMCIYAVGVYT